MRTAIAAAIAAILILTAFATLASANPYSSQLYSTARPSYYGQYDYKQSFAYLGRNYFPVNAFGRAGQPFYYGYGGSRPTTISSTSCNVLIGCRTAAVSHMYVGSALDYAYYSDPSLLNPRGMNNHQRWVRANYPDRFYY